MEDLSEKWETNNRAEGLPVLMPGHTPDRVTQEAGSVWWVFAHTDDGVRQIARIYHNVHDRTDLYGAEFLASDPTPAALRCRILPRVGSYEVIWMDVCEALLDAGAVTVHRGPETKAIEPPPVF